MLYHLRMLLRIPTAPPLPIRLPQWSLWGWRSPWRSGRLPQKGRLGWWPPQQSWLDWGQPQHAGGDEDHQGIIEDHQCVAEDHHSRVGEDPQTWDHHGGLGKTVQSTERLGLASGALSSELKGILHGSYRTGRVFQVDLRGHLRAERKFMNHLCG